MQPSEGLFKVANAMFSDLWASRLAEVGEAKALLKREIKALDKQINSLLDRVLEAESPSVVKAYERKVS